MKRLFPAFILLVLLLCAVFFAQMRLKQTNIPELYPVPSFEFKSQFGDNFTNNDFAGKISVVDFIFTSCPGICPVMANKMSALYQEYEQENDVQFVSFSVDPARDSLETLIEYAQNLGIKDNRWKFLRTEKAAIDTLYEKGFKLGGELPYGHSGAFVLIDENGIIRGYYNYNDIESLALLEDHINILIDEL